MFEVASNPSIAALVGAAAAYFLVVLTDIRRRYRKRTVIKNLISDNLDHARSKLENVETDLGNASTNRIGGAPIMQFDSATIRQYQVEVSDILDANQNQAVSTVVFWMEAVDSELLRARETADKIRSVGRRHSNSEEINILVDEYKEFLGNARMNLGILIRMLNLYVDGTPEKVLEIRHSGTY